MKTILAGGRDYFFSCHDIDALDALNITEVVSGCATGADTCGEEWAKSRNIPIKQFPADWKKLKHAAGPIRNRQMAQYADAVVLFPGGKGTLNMFNEAKKHGLIIHDWRNY